MDTETGTAGTGAAGAATESTKLIASNGKNDNKEKNKTKCCTWRTTIIILVVLLVLVIIFYFVIFPEVKPQIAKKKSIDAMGERITKTTKSILIKMNPYVSAVAASLGGDLLQNSIDTTNEDVKSNEFDLGWIQDESIVPYGWKQATIIYDDTSTTYPSNASVVIVNVRQLTTNFQYDIITEDDIFGIDQDFAMNAEGLRNQEFLPLRDNFHFITTDDKNTLNVFLEDMRLRPLGLKQGYLLPVPYHHWEEMTSDDAISRIFWYGIGSVLIMGPEFSELYDATTNDVIGYEIDLDISSLAVRKGYHPYGFKITFDANQKLQSIYDPTQGKLLFPPSSSSTIVEWERAKYLVKHTVMTVITAREHLQWTHLIGSNTLTRANVIHLPPSHPLRRLITIFTFNTNGVNAGAEGILTPEYGWVHRMTALEYPALLQVFDIGVGQCNIFQPFKDIDISSKPGLSSLIENGKFPFYTEALAYYNIVNDFVANWFDFAGNDAMTDQYAKAFYSELVKASKGQAYQVPKKFDKQRLIDIVAQLIWTVTAYHELVGTVVEYLTEPSYMGFRAVNSDKGPNRKTKNMVIADTETFTLAALLTALTGIRMPYLFAPFPNFFGKDGAPEWEIAVWASFQADIGRQGELVKAADADRIANGLPEFKMMDPTRFECAVSV